jgi:hypothetical protein
MQPPRLTRFKRANKIAVIQITARDNQIIRLVHQHRFLRSSHILSLLGGSHQSLLRRLQLLYHHGFLERPRSQLDYYHQGGSRHIIYGLGNRGAALLRDKLGSSMPSLRWGEKNRSLGRIFLEHALMISDVMVAIKLACRRTGNVRLLEGDELPRNPDSTGAKPFKWGVNLNPRVRLGVVPDGVFALDSEDQAPERNPAFFFLEADRGTMPVTRNNLNQTSFYRKLLAYEATWLQGIHRSQFGFHRFRVLTVTRSPERVQSLVEACSRLKSGHGLFLFTDLATFQKHEDVFLHPWQTGRAGQVSGILE